MTVYAQINQGFYFIIEFLKGKGGAEGSKIKKEAVDWLWIGWLRRTDFSLGIHSPYFILTDGCYDCGFSYSNRIKIWFKNLVFMMWQFYKLMQLSIRHKVHTWLPKKPSFLADFLNAVESPLKNRDNIIRPCLRYLTIPCEHTC